MSALSSTTDFEIVYSRLASSMYQSPIRGISMSALARKTAGEDVALLAGGCPHESLFPVTEVAVTLRDGSVASRRIDDALQYHSGGGLVDLVSKMRALNSSVHGRERETVLTVGNTDALVKTVELLTEPGDVIFCEEYTWSGFYAVCCPRGRRIVGVPMDDDGLIPSALEDAVSKEHGQRLLYTIPAGQNPTGSSASLERKRAIYEVCRRHNLVIVEDDPYYFLDMGEEQAGADPLKLPASYLRLDEDRRVVRLDSWSKIAAPGFRVGWVACPNVQFAAHLRTLNETSCQFPSGVSQAALLALLDHWEGGLDGHLRSLQLAYKRRRDTLCRALNASLDPTLAVWDVPTSGMFLWLKQLVVEDSAVLLDDLLAAGCACVPGGCFRPPGEEEAAAKSPFIRLTFASASDDEMHAGATRLAAALRKFKTVPK